MSIVSFLFKLIVLYILCLGPIFTRSDVDAIHFNSLSISKSKSKSKSKSRSKTKLEKIKTRLRKLRIKANSSEKPKAFEEIKTFKIRSFDI